MTNFKQFDINSALLKALENMQITVPTPIQRETLPLALKGLDVLASAQTGSGKTVAYLIPLIMKLMENPEGSALILAPTRELAMQVQQALNQLLGGQSSFLRSVLIIGGASMFKQLSELKRRPRIVIGTPGRINDHLARRTLHLQSTCFLVIDEADRMLDMGFGVQLDRIAEFLTYEKRQSLLFSATMPPNIARLSQRYLRDPQRVSIDANIQTPAKIQQEILHMKSSEKRTQLVEQLNKREGSIIVFVRTRRKAESMSNELRDEGHETDAMHGDLPQRKREQVIRSFRANKSRILIATDVAARGLDIPHVMHVINYDLPECPEDYVHRIGRTGRAGAEGFALSLIAPEDRSKWNAISRLLDPESAKRGNHRDDEGAPERRFGRQKRFGGGRSQERRSFGGPRKPRSFDDRGPRAPRPPRQFDDAPRAPRQFGDSFGDRPQRSFNKPSGDFSDRKPGGRFGKPSGEGFKKKRFGGHARFR